MENNISVQNLRVNVPAVKKVPKKRVRWDRVTLVIAASALIGTLIATGIEETVEHFQKVDAIKYQATNVGEEYTLSQGDLLQDYTVNNYSFINGESYEFNMTPQECVEYFRHFVQLMEKSQAMGFDTNKIKPDKVETAQDDLAPYIKDGLFDLDALEQLMVENPTAYKRNYDYINKACYDFADIYQRTMKRAIKENVCKTLNNLYNQHYDVKDITLHMGDGISVTAGYSSYNFGDSTDVEVGSIWGVVDFLDKTDASTLSDLTELSAASRAGLVMSQILVENAKEEGIIFQKVDVNDQKFLGEVERMYQEYQASTNDSFVQESTSKGKSK